MMSVPSKIVRDNVKVHVTFRELLQLTSGGTAEGCLPTGKCKVNRNSLNSSRWRFPPWLVGSIAILIMVGGPVALGITWALVTKGPPPQ